MYRLMMIVAFIALGSKLTAQTSPTLKWYGWNEGYPLAMKSGKILLIDAYTDWCGWCKKMDRDTYSDAKIIEKINQYFIPVKFNPELTDQIYYVDSVSMSASELFMQFTRGERTGFPTTYFIQPQKRRLMIDPGYRDAATFMQILDKVVTDFK